MSAEKFKSKKGFILASIGAAVGLGNALRFPGLCAKYGGGTFLFIYFIALIVLGIPLLNAEIALGRKLKGAAPTCMSALTSRRPKLGAAVGWTSCLNSLFTAVIYAGLAGWIISMIITIVPLSTAAPSLSRTQISQYFFQTTLNAAYDGGIHGISLIVAPCIIVAWVFMYLCLRGGAGTLAKAAKFTVAIPLVLLVFMAARGLMYSNSAQALSALFTPDFSHLAEPELWITALGQVFFSLSVVVGIMPTYGSYLPEGTNIFTCSLIIAAADFLVSVLASTVLFTTLYGCGLQSEISPSGIVTAFVIYPAAITMLFGANTTLNAAVGVLFYSSLAMMAVQSAVSMLEAFLSPFAAARQKPKKSYALKICLIGGAISLIFATTAAPVIVDISDRFINFYNVLLLGIAECVLIAFSKKSRVLVEEINKFTKKLKMSLRLFNFSVKFASPLILTSLCVIEAISVATVGFGYPPWLLFAFGIGASLTVFIVGACLSEFFTPKNNAAIFRGQVLTL